MFNHKTRMTDLKLSSLKARYCFNLKGGVHLKSKEEYKLPAVMAAKERNIKTAIVESDSPQFIL